MLNLFITPIACAVNQHADRRSLQFCTTHRRPTAPTHRRRRYLHQRSNPSGWGEGRWWRCHLPIVHQSREPCLSAPVLSVVCVSQIASSVPRKDGREAHDPNLQPKHAVSLAKVGAAVESRTI